jgi:PAS domain S-box-containing protein
MLYCYVGMVKKDNSTFWANFILTAIRDQAGDLIGFAHISRDYTPNKHAQEKIIKQQELLMEAEERQRLLIDSVTDYAIFMLDINGAISSWNTGAQRLKGYQAEEILGKHFSIFYPALDVATGKPQRELLVAQQHGRFEEEGFRKRKDGSEFWANVIITAMRSKTTGDLLGFAKITRDMTERKNAQERLLQQQHALVVTADRLKQADVAKTLFLQKLSHELRAPLNPVTLILSAFLDRYKCKLLALNPPKIGEGNEVLSAAEPQNSQNPPCNCVDHDASSFPPTEIVEDIDTALKCIQRETMLIDDLLDTTRLGVGKLKLDIHYDDLHALMNEIVATIRRGDAKGKQLTIHTELQATQSMAYIDSNRMSQVFLNILYNSVKFSRPHDTITVTTHNEIFHNARYIVISIADQGIGIEKSYLDKIFELFAQAPVQPSSTSAGLGLGLAIVKGILSLHGATITASSKGHSKGAEFTIKFPLDYNSKSSSSSSPAQSASSTPATSTRTFVEILSPSKLQNSSHDLISPLSNSCNSVATSGLFNRKERASKLHRAADIPAAVKNWRILIVEDDVISLKLLNKFVERLGFTDISTADSVDAAKLIISQSIQQDQRIDLLISDLNLPDGSGFDVMRIISQDKLSKIRGIVCSGSGAPEDAKKSKQAGFALHLVKPVDALKLTDAIATLTCQAVNSNNRNNNNDTGSQSTVPSSGSSSSSVHSIPSA